MKKMVGPVIILVLLALGASAQKQDFVALKGDYIRQWKLTEEKLDHTQVYLDPRGINAVTKSDSVWSDADGVVHYVLGVVETPLEIKPSLRGQIIVDHDETFIDTLENGNLDLSVAVMIDPNKEEGYLVFHEESDGYFVLEIIQDDEGNDGFWYDGDFYEVRDRGFKLYFKAKKLATPKGKKRKPKGVKVS